MARQWADKYGPRWYLHYDGHPPHDDDTDYKWNGFQWVAEDESIDEAAFEEWEARRRERAT